MRHDTTPREQPHARPDQERQEPLRIWRNTRPRGNPETDRQDLARSQARMEAVLGR